MFLTILAIVWLVGMLPTTFYWGTFFKDGSQWFDRNYTKTGQPYMDWFLYMLIGSWLALFTMMYLMRKYGRLQDSSLGHVR